MIGGQPPPTDKATELNDKMLELAQDLFLEEIDNDSLFACGNSFTSKVAGKYGWYETCNGEVISFLPKSSLYFTLSWGEILITGQLATIQAISHRLSDYELFVNKAV
jgi:hypothetical protein